MSNIPVREMIKNSVVEIGGKVSKNQIVQWISEKYGDVNHNTIRTQANACSVNQPSRIHLPECGKPRPFDSRYDFLFNTGDGKVELYDPKKHGNWELVDHEGKTTISKDGIPIVKDEKSALLEFLKNTMASHMRSNYMPIVIKMLLESTNHSTSIQKIRKKFDELNFGRGSFVESGTRPLGNTAITAVRKALKEFTIFPDSTSEGEVKLIEGGFNESDKEECLKICGQEIAKWHIDKISEQEYEMWHILPGSRGTDFMYLDEFLKPNLLILK